MTEFSASASLEVRPEQRSLRAARDEIEDALGDISVTVEGSASGGASAGRSTRLAGKERAMGRQLSTRRNQHLASLDEWSDDIEQLAIERNELLHEIVDGVEGSGRLSGAGGLGGLGAIGGGAVGISILGLGIVSDLTELLNSYEWPELEVPDWIPPKIPNPDWLPPKLSEPDWLPIEIPVPPWLPIDGPGGSPSNNPSPRRTPVPGQPTGLPNPGDLPGETTASDPSPTSNPTGNPSPLMPPTALEEKLRRVIQETPEAVAVGGAAAGAGAARAVGGASGASGGTPGFSFGIPFGASPLIQALERGLFGITDRARPNRQALRANRRTQTVSGSVDAAGGGGSSRTVVNHSPTYNLDTKRLERKQQQDMKELERRIKEIERGLTR